MPHTADLGSAGLVGWRKTLADRVSPPVARHSPADEEHVRALIGATFFVLSLYYVISTAARAIKSQR